MSNSRRSLLRRLLGAIAALFVGHRSSGDFPIMYGEHHPDFLWMSTPLEDSWYVPDAQEFIIRITSMTLVRDGDALDFTVAIKREDEDDREEEAGRDASEAPHR